MEQTITIDPIEAINTYQKTTAISTTHLAAQLGVPYSCIERALKEKRASPKCVAAIVDLLKIDTPKKSKYTKRICLRCNKPFFAASKFIRICGLCKTARSTVDICWEFAPLD